MKPTQMLQKGIKPSIARETAKNIQELYNMGLVICKQDDFYFLKCIILKFTCGKNVTQTSRNIKLLKLLQN